MKVRNGFVSNSSSTSFAIIGVNNYQFPIPNELAILSGISYDEDYDGHGECLKNSRDGNSIDFYGMHNEWYYAGIDAEAAMETMLLNEAKLHFKRLAAELGLDISLDRIDFHHGETGEG